MNGFLFIYLFFPFFLIEVERIDVTKDLRIIILSFDILMVDKSFKIRVNTFDCKYYLSQKQLTTISRIYP